MIDATEINSRGPDLWTRGCGNQWCMPAFFGEAVRPGPKLLSITSRDLSLGATLMDARRPEDLQRSIVNAWSLQIKWFVHLRRKRGPGLFESGLYEAFTLSCAVNASKRDPYQVDSRNSAL